jgi:ribonucleotide reductase beta subunit family protein with ferritin-like domain
MAKLLNSERLSFSPNSDPAAFDFFIQQQKILWNPTDVSTAQDYLNFCKLTENARIPLLKVLAIFQTLDGSVIDHHKNSYELIVIIITGN